MKKFVATITIALGLLAGAGTASAETPPILGPADPIVQPNGRDDSCITFSDGAGHVIGQTRWSLQPCGPSRPAPVAACKISIGEYQLGSAAVRQSCATDIYMAPGRRSGRTVAQRCARLGGSLGTGRFKGQTWQVCRIR